MKNMARKAAVHISDMLLLFMAQLGVLYFIINTLNFTVDRTFLYFTLVFTALCYWFMKTKWLKIAFGIMIVAAVIYMLPYRAGLFPAALGAASRFAARYDFVFRGGNEPDGDFKGDCTAFFVLASIVLAIILSLLMCGKKRRLMPAAVFTAAVFIPCIVVSIKPDKLTVLVLLTFWSVCMICAGGRKADELKSAVMTFIALPLFFALYGGALCAIRPDSYERKHETDLQMERIIKTGNTLLGKLGITDGVSGGFDRGSGGGTNTGGDGGVREYTGTAVWSDSVVMDLSSVGPLTRTGDVILRVKSENSGKLYLRGYSMDTYTGSGWMSYDMLLSVLYDYSDVVALSSESIRNSTGAGEAEMEIEPLAVESRVMFTPYYYSGSDAQSEVQQREGCVIQKDGTSGAYTVRYVPYDGEPSAITSPAAGLDRYMEQAADRNLSLSQPIADELREIAGEAGISHDDENVIEEVAEFIQGAAVYNINTPATPQGEDFVLYFLRESRQGYCVHFASAAVAMYRALGIPARYVSGFMFDVLPAETGRWVNVTDYDAHAWAEVFVPQMGWVPVEVTGGLSSLQEDGTVHEQEQEENTPAPPENGSQQQNTEGQQAGSEISAWDRLRGNNNFITGVIAAAAVLFAVVLVVLRRGIVCFARKCAFAGKNVNKSAVKILKYFEKLSVYGVRTPEEVRTTAERACFSRNGISRRERDIAAKSAECAAKNLADRSDGLERLLLKYVFCLI